MNDDREKPAFPAARPGEGSVPSGGAGAANVRPPQSDGPAPGSDDPSGAQERRTGGPRRGRSSGSGRAGPGNRGAEPERGLDCAAGVQRAASAASPSDPPEPGPSAPRTRIALPPYPRELWTLLAIMNFRAQRELQRLRELAGTPPELAGELWVDGMVLEPAHLDVYPALLDLRFDQATCVALRLFLEYRSDEIAEVLRQPHELVLDMLRDAAEFLRDRLPPAAAAFVPGALLSEPQEDPAQGPGEAADPDPDAGSGPTSGPALGGADLASGVPGPPEPTAQAAADPTSCGGPAFAGPSGDSAAECIVAAGLAVRSGPDGLCASARPGAMDPVTTQSDAASPDGMDPETPVPGAMDPLEYVRWLMDTHPPDLERGEREVIALFFADAGQWELSPRPGTPFLWNDDLTDEDEDFLVAAAEGMPAILVAYIELRVSLRFAVARIAEGLGLTAETVREALAEAAGHLIRRLPAETAMRVLPWLVDGPREFECQ